MSEVRRALKCLSCGAVVWEDGALPDACPSCAAPWREPGVAILRTAAEPYELADGASILKEP